MHNIWIWICKIKFDPLLSLQEIEEIKHQKINYEEINSKWNNLINLEYSKLGLKINRIIIIKNLSIEASNALWLDEVNKFKSNWCCNLITNSFPLINY